MSEKTDAPETAPRSDDTGAETEKRKKPYSSPRLEKHEQIRKVGLGYV